MKPRSHILSRTRRLLKQYFVQNALNSSITTRGENLSAYRESRKAHSADCPNLPLTLQVEVTRACNLSCRMCNVHHGSKAGMTINDEVLEASFELAKTAIAVYPFGLGEPLLYPSIAEVVGKYKSQGTLVALISNGMLLNEKMARELIENGLDNLTISFDAAEPGLFNKVRRGADFHVISNNISTLNGIKESLKVSNPVVSLNVVAQRSNFVQLPQIIVLAEKWNISSVNLTPIAIHEHIPDLENESLSHITHWREVLDQCHNEGEKRKINVQSQGLYFTLNNSAPDLIYEGVVPCPEPFHFMGLSVDGEMFPCCHWDLENPLARFPDVGLKKAWKSKKWQLLRRQTISNQYCKICKNCMKHFSRPLRDSYAEM